MSLDTRSLSGQETSCLLQLSEEADTSLHPEAEDLCRSFMLLVQALLHTPYLARKASAAAPTACNAALVLLAPETPGDECQQ